MPSNSDPIDRSRPLTSKRGAVAGGLLLWALASVPAPAWAQFCEGKVNSIAIPATTHQDLGYLAIDPGTHLLFVAIDDYTAADADRLLVVDLASETIVADVEVGRSARAIAVNPDTHRVYVAYLAAAPSAASVAVFDGDPSSATFLDELDSFDLSDRPKALAIDPILDELIVHTTASDGSRSLLVVDATTLTTQVTLALVGEDLGGLAIDPLAHRVFTLRNKIGTSDSAHLQRFELLGNAPFISPLGSESPFPSVLGYARAIAVDPASNRVYGGAYSLSGLAHIEAFDATSGVHLDGVAVDGFIGTQLALDPSRERGFVNVSVDSARAIAVLGTNPLALSHVVLTTMIPSELVVDPTTHRIFSYQVFYTPPQGARIDVYVHDASDDDADGLANSCDNCPGDPNPDQSDVDGDSAGDACDPDIDNDGCFNEDDQEPASSVQRTGSWISESCNPQSGSTFESTGQDSDSDGMLDCADLDDDDDGTSDADDPCPTLAGIFSCFDTRACGVRNWWDTCLFSSSCREYFVRVVSVVNPDPTVVFLDVEILNTSLWVAPAFGTSLQDAASLLAGAAPGGPAARSAGAPDRMRIELWSKPGQHGPERFVELVAEYDPGDLRLGDLSRGRWLIVHPPGIGSADPTIRVDASWIPGGDDPDSQPDADGDGTPNVFDACLVAPSTTLNDSDEDGFGNRCDADYDDDGLVDRSDQGTLLSAVGETCRDPGYRYELDADSDCLIGQAELDLLAAQIAGPPGPSGSACPPGTSGYCDHGLPACSNGRDDDGDGRADFPGDLDCADPFDPTEVPEPGAMAMVAFGVAQLHWMMTRRRRSFRSRSRASS